MVSIPSASFFSFATTFSLPGITTYSVSKSFSTSTPSVLLGRSFTWPSDASTVKPLPRYFWMVFALAGDSTITKPLVNVSSVDYYAFCETSTNAVAATSGRPRLSALSSQLVKERSQHTFYFDGPFRKSLIINGRQELQITSEQEMVLKFTGRAHRNLQEARKFAITLSTGSFGNVRSDRSSRPSHLTR